MGNEDVTQNVGVRGWQRHALEIAFKRSSTFRAGSMELRPDRAHSRQSILGSCGHNVSGIVREMMMRRDYIAG
jgi:hypothetical protein